MKAPYRLAPVLDYLCRIDGDGGSQYDSSESGVVERRARWVETWHNITRRSRQPMSIDVYGHVDGHYNRRARRDRVFANKKGATHHRRRPDKPEAFAISTYDGIRKMPMMSLLKSWTDTVVLLCRGGSL